MTRLSVALAATVALFTLVLAEDTPDVLMKQLVQDSVVLQEEFQETDKVEVLRYITCEGTTWSCEDCNTRRWCLEVGWYTGITYLQCPTWAPYCDSSNPSLCTKNGSSGCTGNNSTA